MIVAIVVILALSLILQSILPWWTVAVAAFVGGYLRSSSGWKATGAGFAGIGILWLLSASFIHLKTGGILTSRVGEMLGLPMPFLVIFVTAILGGGVGGLAAATGYHFRKLFKQAQHGNEDSRKNRQK